MTNTINRNGIISPPKMGGVSVPDAKLIMQECNRFYKDPDNVQLIHALTFEAPMLYVAFWEYLQRARHTAAKMKIEALKQWSRDVDRVLAERKHADKENRFLLESKWERYIDTFLDNEGDQPLFLLYLSVCELFSNRGIIDGYKTPEGGYKKGLMQLFAEAYMAILLYAEADSLDCKNNELIFERGYKMRVGGSPHIRIAADLMADMFFKVGFGQAPDPTAAILTNAHAVAIALRNIEIKIEQ